MNALKLDDLVNYKTALIMFKAKNNLLPSNILKLFIEKRGNLGTRQMGNFQQVFVRTTLKSMSVSVRGVKLWNSFNLELKNSQSVNIFKRRFKIEILKKYKQL